ncbi:MAG: PadR family transcriptional regulator [Spirochaetia bacterium]|nr:PadR family transcriptional regulator [Spirochaetia bacterium]
MVLLSTSEMALLAILYSEGELSGYQINKIITERGFREWADIGSTSIYVGLKKLENKYFIKLVPNLKKTGKGPLPNRYKIIQKGIKILRKEIKIALSSESRYNSKYDLAIASIPILNIADVILALKEKQNKLKKTMHNVRQEKFEKQGGFNLPSHVVLLFERSFMLMQAEIDFTEKALRELK